MNAIRKIDNAKHPRRLFSFAGAAIIVAFGIAGAQAASPADHLNPKPAGHHHWYQFGIASWYGHFFQGKTTASGEPFNENALTCAHRTLPLGSVLKVTNLRNNRSVIVTVNDRGPVPKDRVIDLSKAAAEDLGFSERGLAPVKVELIGPIAEVAQLTAPSAPPATR